MGSSPKVFVFPSRKTSLSFSAEEAGNNSQCCGYFGFISSSDLQKYVRDGQLCLSAELSLLETNK
jgi:hypothetical protein